MYEQHWNLNCKPFESAAHGDFYYPSESHQGAQLKLRYAIENKRSAAVLSGPSGTGKSLVIATLFDGLSEEYQPKVHVVFPQMPATQLMAYIATELGAAPTPPTSIDESVRTIRDFLATNTFEGRHAIIAIDEAHLIEDAESLEAIRLLTNFDTSGTPNLTMILTGQPQMLPVLDRFESLDDRIGVKCLIRPLNIDETASYVSHRMTAAGANRTIFEMEAMETIHALSRGVPRRINRLCDLSLLIAYAEQRETISTEQIESVCDEIVTVAPE